tara:strand:- start:1718 stop:2269 length:552 start_codon:yes stop_codon:yes gene_type:complete
MDKDKYLKITTPLGIAKWPWLTKADTKFNADGVYKTDLLLSSGETKSIAGQLKAFYERHFPNKKGKMPYKKEVDDTGKETGNYIFKFKSKNKPAVFDASGKPMQDVNVFGGSKIKVSATASPYNAAGNQGVTLYLNAVQVIDLVTGETGSSTSFGFAAEEGYKHEAGEIESVEENTESSADDF